MDPGRKNGRVPLLVERLALRGVKSLAGSSAHSGGSWVYHIGLVSQRPDASEPAGLLFLFGLERRSRAVTFAHAFEHLEDWVFGICGERFDRG
jgi:hypothetical protein